MLLQQFVPLHRRALAGAEGGVLPCNALHISDPIRQDCTEVAWPWPATLAGSSAWPGCRQGWSRPCWCLAMSSPNRRFVS
ncbi:hypothetical protein G6F31_021114 [Rhizopus arrhizus]|nr:hypothetical protein G6F31_021114 [Rhizopus arrhizus]